LTVFLRTDLEARRGGGGVQRIMKDVDMKKRPGDGAKSLEEIRGEYIYIFMQTEGGETERRHRGVERTKPWARKERRRSEK
jgi:hypothetical protein